MTILSHGLDDSGAFDAVSIVPVPPRPASRRREALGLLLSGLPDADDPGIDGFVGFIRQQRLALDHFWAAYYGEQPLAAALIVACAGRTGMLFMSPVHDDDSAELTARVIRAACEALRPGSMSMLQALLDSEQAPERRALMGGGFHRLAELSYMARRTAPQEPPPPALPDGVELLPWKRSRRALFGRGILESYRDTRDCPGLVGLRDIDDIIAGHQATGKFDAELWRVAVAEGEPAGVILLNPIPQRGVVELVYLGLSPSWRGRGLGATLLRHGLFMARSHSARDVVLAVDADNEPALRLYRQHGFVARSHKTAFVAALAR